MIDGLGDGVFIAAENCGPDKVVNETAFNILKATHDTLSFILLGLAVLHVLAALKHHFWNKDDVFVRMLPFTKSEKRS